MNDVLERRVNFSRVEKSGKRKEQGLEWVAVGRGGWFCVYRHLATNGNPFSKIDAMFFFQCLH